MSTAQALVPNALTLMAKIRDYIPLITVKNVKMVTVLVGLSVKFAFVIITTTILQINLTEPCSIAFQQDRYDSLHS